MQNDQAGMTEYEFEPFETIFLSRREEIVRLVDVSAFALRSMDGAARISKVLRSSDEHVDVMRKIEALALQEVSSNFPLLHNAATVLLWGALEASFRDFFVRWLSKNPATLQVPALQKIRVSIAEYEGLEGEDRMRYLLGIIERDLAASLKPGVGRFDCILKPFGIYSEVSASDRRDLNELAAIRNVIVHRAGISDARLLELCPWLGLEVGTSVNVARESLDRYIGSASRYAAGIIESVRELSRKSEKRE